jgi:hypothetical protein
MAYYLGRDIDIAITTESEWYGIVIGDGHAYNAESGHQFAKCVDFRVAANVGGTGAVAAGTENSVAYTTAAGASGALFAGPKSLGAETDAAHNPWSGLIEGASAGTAADYLKNQTWTNVPQNIVGMDISFGVQDEDVAFVGQRNVLKAEIKKDNSVTLTRKKSDNTWAVVYNDARFGLIDHGVTSADGLHAFPLAGGQNDETFVVGGGAYSDDPTVTAITASKRIKPGMYVSGTGLAAGQAVDPNLDFVAGSAAGVTSFELTAASTGGALTGQDVTFTATNPFHNGLTAPDYVRCGYRVYLRFGGLTTSDEIFVLRNCYITDYSVTMSADSSQEETITLQSYVDPIITDGIVTEALDTATLVGDL